MKERALAGFTLVELVMVIVLIATLAVLSIGLFAGRSAFSPLLAQQQLSSAVLLAQQAGLAGNGANTLTVTQGADNFVFSIQDTDPSPAVEVHRFSIAREGTSLNLSGGQFQASFDDFGRPSTSYSLPFTFIFTGDSTYRVCLSSLGAVYGGGCQ
jgi:MSHA pilin protein MshC